MNQGTVNLLPTTSTLAVRHHNILVGWGCVALLTMVVIFIAVATRWSQVRQQRHLIADLELRTAGVHELMARVGTMRTDYQQALLVERHLQSLRATDDLLQTLGVIATACASTIDQEGQSDFSELNEFNASNERPYFTRIAIDMDQPQGAWPGKVEMDLQGLDEQRAVALLNALRQSKRLQDLTIQRSKNQPSQAGRPSQTSIQSEVHAGLKVSKELPQ